MRYLFEVVVRECGKLGAFYVGDKVFECKRKDGQ